VDLEAWLTREGYVENGGTWERDGSLVRLATDGADISRVGWTDWFDIHSVCHVRDYREYGLEDRLAVALGTLDDGRLMGVLRAAEGNGWSQSWE
jgi:hypothetical protein